MELYFKFTNILEPTVVASDSECSVTIKHIDTTEIIKQCIQQLGTKDQLAFLSELYTTLAEIQEIFFPIDYLQLSTAGCIIMYLKIVQRNQNSTERNYKPSVEIKVMISTSSDNIPVLSIKYLNPHPPLLPYHTCCISQFPICTFYRNQLYNR